MSTIVIVEYQPKYAKAIADMWNRSSSVWNGRLFNSSEKKVLQEESTPCLNLYLAILDDLVIGYARFALYPEEKGVSCIEMLGVDPEWHGKGIGKQLVQKCVLRAAELGYERIDLFTWAGNTKAVPLYKKCGFFWEKMETQATHLMNFLPGLLNNELLKPYFEYFDWYLDSKRETMVEPDGRECNGFDLYDYIWEKDDKKLQISFERTGRGIVAIVTPDFMITSEILQAKPVFGVNYQIRYNLESISGVPHAISIQGKDDSVVQYAFEYSVNLTDKREIVGEFYLNPIQKDLTEWETTPGVVSMLTVNGKSLTMKTGLKIQYPLSTKFSMEKNLVSANQECVIYLNVKNSFPNTCHYLIDFKDEYPLKLEKNQFEITLKPFEKSNIPITFSTPEACIFYPTMHITAQPDQGKEIRFTRQVSLAIHSLTSKAQKSLPDCDYLLNGMNGVFFANSQKNWGSYRSDRSSGFNLCPPQIGKPFSEEFDQEDPYKVEINDLGYANELIRYFKSKEFPEVDFAYVYKLYPTGLMEFNIRIISIPEAEKDIFLKIRMGMSGTGLVVDLYGRLLRMDNDMPGLETYHLDGEEIGSNWVFSKTDDYTYAMIWDKSWHAFIDRWLFSWELNLSEYRRSGLVETETIHFYLDVLKGPLSVRDIAEEKDVKVTPTYPTLELVVNEGNPFVKDALQIELIQHQTENMRGSFILSSATKLIPPQEITHIIEDEIRKISWNIDSETMQGMEMINCEAKLPLYTVQRKQAAFHSTGEMKLTKKNEVHGDLLTADNGIIKITAALNPLLPGLISLEQQDREWLDKGYPEHAPKSHYNPYPGGITIAPWNIKTHVLASEKHITEYATLVDQWGNQWQGLSIQTTITQFEPLNGLIFKLHYLLLPGIPVIAIVSQMIEDSGHAEYTPLAMNVFLHPDDDMQNSSIHMVGENHVKQELCAGTESLNYRNVYKHTSFHTKKSPDKLNLLSLGRSYHEMHVDPLILRDKCYIYGDFGRLAPYFLEPFFIVFSIDDIDYESMIPLLTTRFETIQN